MMVGCDSDQEENLLLNPFFFFPKYLEVQRLSTLKHT